jgi:hypothetical protein
MGKTVTGPLRSPQFVARVFSIIRIQNPDLRRPTLPAFHTHQAASFQGPQLTPPRPKVRQGFATA